MPPELKGRLEREAAASGVSLNSLIVERLEKTNGAALVEQPELVDGAGRPLALEEAAVSIPAAGDGEQARAARQAAASSSAKRRSAKLDPNCTNAQYHWRVEPGNVCTYCGGSR